MMERSIVSVSKKVALFLTLLLLTCTLPHYTASSGEDEGMRVEEGAEPDWWENWLRDENRNGIDDLIEEKDGEERIGVFINYKNHPDERDVERITRFDLDVKYVYNYIDVICARNVAVSDVKEITELPNVVMVKLEPEIYPLLDVSSRAIKATASNEYSPNTAADLGIRGKEVSVAILDTGVDDGGLSPNQHHESLDDMDDDASTSNDPKFIAGVDFTQDESFLYPRDGSYNPDDNDGHGTHVAGIALGTGGSLEGQYRGVAPGARLIDLKVMESFGAQGDPMGAIEWCIDHRSEYNIRVLSMSYGTRWGESDGKDEQSLLVNKAVEEGMVVVAAIGNDGENRVTSPAAADGAIAVGSVDDTETVERSDDTLSSFSNTGPRMDDGDADSMDELKPDVVAYGEGIMSALVNTHASYIAKSGTSMSCPHVSGAVALMLEANSALSPEDVKDILRASAEARGSPSYPGLDPKYNTNYGWGIVDAYKAVEMARGFVELDITIDSPTDWETV